MREISPEELLAQLDETVARFVASPAEQDRWVDKTRFPAEEIALEYYDAMRAFLGRLRDNGLIDGSDEVALRELEEYVQLTQTKLFVDNEHFVDGWYVTKAPEWLRVRELAAVALASLRRPISEKRR